MNRKVKIKFMQNYAYDNSYFMQFDDFVLSFEDAIELVNKEIGVITYIYD